MFLKILNQRTLSYNLFQSKTLNSSNISRIKPCIGIFNSGNRILHKNLSNHAAHENMKAWKTDEYSGIQGIELSTSKIPMILKPSEVLIKVSAASVNPIDVAILDGYGNSILQVLRDVDQVSTGKCDMKLPAFPLTVGRDFVGKVVRVGQCVSKIKVNDTVWGVVAPQRQGCHAEYVVTESYNVCPKPDYVTDIEAASIPYVALTSWSAAVTTGALVPNECFGSQVLVIGASGGVGTFVTQLLSAWGAEVTGVCSESSFDLALSCGVSELHDYRDPETMHSLRTRPRFDLILDAAGFNDVRWAQALKEWNNASYVTLVSPLLRNTDQKGLFGGLMKSLLKLVHQNSTTLPRGRFCKWAYFMPNEQALREVAKLVGVGKIRPVVDKVFKAEDAKLALEHVKDGHKKGKTVLDFSA